MRRRRPPRRWAQPRGGGGPPAPRPGPDVDRGPVGAVPRDRDALPEHPARDRAGRPPRPEGWSGPHRSSRRPGAARRGRLLAAAHHRDQRQRAPPRAPPRHRRRSRRPRRRAQPHVLDRDERRPARRADPRSRADSGGTDVLDPGTSGPGDSRTLVGRARSSQRAPPKENLPCLDDFLTRRATGVAAATRPHHARPRRLWRRSSGSSSGERRHRHPPLPSVSADAALAAKVPASIKEDGVITVGSDTTYAPSEFLAADGKTIDRLRRRPVHAGREEAGPRRRSSQTAPFDSIIAGVGSQKYEVGVSSFTINADREAQANMVSYYSRRHPVGDQEGQPANIDPENACGKKIAVQKATVQVDDITARSTEVHGRRQAGDHDRPVRRAERRHRGGRLRQGRRRARRLPGHGLRGQADQRPARSCSARSTTRRPTATSSPKDQTEFAQAIADAVQGADRGRQLQEGARRTGASRPARSPTRP